ncbi:TetR/AcrR family transcriptional regulator [Mycobacterium vicinigordonae]|uniref:TetR/AcrR family transcriptional regulator n=1 Tax=Mycobacterium vicinigordonae TaxID=1719132 RepID=A0A7D6IQB6_9MYCO|nr:TetR/AcrR family transcriptional regulator [Mycobacterium vicinigordonae]QLL06379.1 TetR/AcrR family transcriptional regulator [Mycobacterium vicinigordonae]
MSSEKTSRRSRVLQEAARLFMACGYSGTSMDDIASALGFTKPALYHYFQAKSDILYEIYSNVAEEINARVQRHPPDWSPDRRLHQMMHDVMDLVRQMPVEVTVFFQEGPLLSSCLPRRQAKALRALEQRFTDYVVDAVDDAMQAGIMRPMDPTLTGYAFIAMVSWAARWYRPGGRASASEIADLYFAIAMDGARSPGEPAR